MPTKTVRCIELIAQENGTTSVGLKGDGVEIHIDNLKHDTHSFEVGWDYEVRIEHASPEEE